MVKRSVALKAATGINPKGVYAPKNQAPMTRMGIANILRNFLQDSKDYRDKKIENKDCKEKLPEFNLALENGMKVINREIPLKVHTYIHDIMTVLEIAKEFDIDVTIDHGLGSSNYYEELTDSHIKGVIMGPICAPLFPGEGGILDIEACKGLDDRGVLVSVITDGPVTKQGLLVLQAGEAVRKGMDPDRALAMLTINAAKMLMCDDRIGSIEEGKDADILIFDSMPTENPGSVMETVIIDGEIVYKI